MTQPRTSTAPDDARPPRPARKTRAKSTGPRRTAPQAVASSKSPNLEALRSELLGTVAKHYPQADLAPVGAAFDLAV